MNKLSEEVEGSFSKKSGVQKSDFFFLKFSAGKSYFETTDFPKQKTNWVLPVAWKSGTR